MTLRDYVTSFTNPQDTEAYMKQQVVDIDYENAMNEPGLQDNSLDFLLGKFGSMVKPSIVAPTVNTGRNAVHIQSPIPNKLLTGKTKDPRYTKSLDGVDPKGIIFPIRPSAFDTQANNLGDIVPHALDKKQRYEALEEWGPIKDVDGFPKDWYHGSTNTPTRFEASSVGRSDKINPQNDWGDWSWHSPSARYTEPYTINHLGKEVVNPNTFKNNINAKKVFDPDNAEDMLVFEKFMNKKNDANAIHPSTLRDMIDGVKDKANGWSASEQPLMREFLEKLGYDGQYIFHQGAKNIMVRNPSAIKSVNNPGTYDSSSDTMKSLIPGIGIAGLLSQQGGNNE